MQSSRTSLTLLGALCDPENQAAWEHFDATYRPMLVRLGLQLGLDADGAEEASHPATLAIHKELKAGSYDASKGRFRNWILGIARHEIADLFVERARQPLAAGQKSDVAKALALLSDSQSFSQVWESEWREHVLATCFQQASEKFNERDMQIFKLLTIEQLAVADVAKEMRVRPATVYQIKHRVLSFMGKIKAELESYG